MEGVPLGESKKPKGVSENETELIGVNFLAATTSNI